MAEAKIIRGLRVLTEEGIRPAAIHTSGGEITCVSAFDEVPREAPIDEYGKALIMPGVVDSHVHANEPGRTPWEGFASATRAAAAGGITTLVDMPLNSIPPTTTLAGLEAKVASALGQLWIDVGLWGGVVPGNAGELERMIEAGALGFKAFMCPSGVDEFPHSERADLERALDVLQATKTPLLAHAEVPGPLDSAAARVAESSQTYRTYLSSRPPEAEVLAIELLSELCRRYRTPVHVVHLSAADALPALRAARDDGLPLSVETCPHYLHFCAEEIADGATAFKCAPPIRGRDNRDRLWDALGTGLIDSVVSDHSPCTADLKLPKSGDFMAAWGGIASLQLSLPVIWTEMRSRGLSVETLAQWMCRRPAELAGLGARKGRLLPGYRADLAVWSPESSFRVAPDQLFHKNATSPYTGELLYGVVQATYLGGEKVFSDGQHSKEPRGTLQRR